MNGDGLRDCVNSDGGNRIRWMEDETRQSLATYDTMKRI